MAVRFWFTFPSTLAAYRCKLTLSFVRVLAIQSSVPVSGYMRRVWASIAKYIQTKVKATALAKYLLDQSSSSKLVLGFTSAHVAVYAIRIITAMALGLKPPHTRAYDIATCCIVAF
jgi:hypothetical protein